MASAILRPNRNVWRIEHAKRACVLVDGAAFFQAVREAFLQAQRSIFVLGWDIDSRTRLVGDDSTPHDSLPATLADFLSELVRRRPELQINLLLWDYSIVYANERELSPRLSLQWSTPPQITLCLDNMVPFGCSQHQKIIVVDDAVAFSGGLDLTIRRWDTPAHSADNRQRVDPSGHPYRPFHDVQMMVDGDAARALAEIARSRWCRAMKADPPPVDPAGDPWPEDFVPDFTDVAVGISRTQPRCNGDAEVHEAEALFYDSIDAAERTLYIENQFVTSAAIAERLARRLRQRPELEAVIVAPRSYDTWVESKSMRNARIRFLQELKQAGGERVQLLYPAVSDGSRDTDTMIHSKVMVVDDRLLRVGSANMNNRSLGADTECDLAIEAKSDRERRAIVEIRDRLLGEHCGAGAAEVSEALARTGSLVATATTLSNRGHRLRPIDDGELHETGLSEALEEIADPYQPPTFVSVWRTLTGRVWGKLDRAVMLGLGVALLIAALTLAWSYTPLSEVADPERVRHLFTGAAREPWALLLVLAVFVAGGLVAFPVIVLIAATGAVFGPWLGFAYALAGVLASALITFGIGARYGQGPLRRSIGPRLERIRARIERQGVIAIATIRVVPIAPFTIVNLVAGASAIKLVDFVAGTLLGMIPGLLVLSALGSQIVRVLSDPSLAEIVLLAVAALGWIGLSFGVQALVSRLWRTS